MINFHQTCFWNTMLKKDYLKYENRKFLITIFLALFQTIFFHVFLTPFLINHDFFCFIPYLVMVLMIFSSYNFIISAFRDPGYIKYDKYELDEQNPALNINVNDAENIPFFSPRFCVTCKLIRPAKASHCPVCNHCVKGYDHHCPFIANCVGVRTWKNFVGFLFFISLTCFFQLIGALIMFINIVRGHPEFFELLKKYYYLGIILILLVLIFIAIVLAQCYHLDKYLKFVKAALCFLFIALSIIYFTLISLELTRCIYEMPLFSLIHVCSMIPITGWVGVTFFNGFFNVLKGKTMKEVIVIQRSELESKISSKIPIKGKVLNFFSFLFYEIPKSEYLNC